MEKHEFSFRQKSLQSKRTLIKDVTQNRQQNNQIKHNGHIGKQKFDSKSNSSNSNNNVDSTTDDDEGGHIERFTQNMNQKKLTMMVMNGISDFNQEKSSCASSEQDNEVDDIYSDNENGDSAIESTNGKDIEKDNGEVIGIIFYYMYNYYNYNIS